MSDVSSVVTPQVPPAGSLNLDHVAHFVPHMEAASAELERLGFTLTPFSAQSHRLEAQGPLVPAGTGNRCVMLERGYLECLTPTGDTALAEQLRVAMRRYVGIHLVAFGTGAADIDHARLVQQGFEPLAPVALQRPIATEDDVRTARFTVVRVPPGTMPEGRIQYCQQHTPDLLWQRRWLTHANGATALASVLLCVADPAEAAQRYSRYSGLAASPSGNTCSIETARGALIFVDAETLRGALGTAPPASPWIAGYALESRDIAATRAYLQSVGIGARELQGGRIAVTLPDALGGILIFQPQGSGALELR
jgi:glyoxalase-like protein